MDLAEECVAEAFRRFLSALKSGHGPRDCLKAYLFRIAHNWLIGYFARQPDDVELEQVEHLPESNHHTEASAELALELQFVRRVLQ